jgi:hypothetical protein
MRIRAIFLIVLIGAAFGGLAALGQAPQLPAQHLVLVIDNSSSMKDHDPQGLRGVAGSLILDSAELGSDLKAALIYFSGSAEIRRPLSPPAEIREQLRPAALPDPDGSTNLEAALKSAIETLAGSSASVRRIVIITDGQPDPGQPAIIVGSLVPQAEAAGIQILSLGLSADVDRAFLQGMAGTRGKSLVATDAIDLLRKAKQLMGKLDNVYPLAEGRGGGALAEVRFTLPPGVDRARVTVALDDPRAYGQNQVRFDVAPTPADSPRPYVGSVSGDQRVAAWTGFLSTSGDYTLSVPKDGGGAPAYHYFVEALSILRAELTLAPDKNPYRFGDDVRVDVKVSSIKGTIDPKDLQIGGEVHLPSGGSVPVTFQTGTGTGAFRVAEVPGQHEVVVSAYSSGLLGRVEVRKSIRVLPPDAPVLLTDPKEIGFPNAISPERPDTAAEFKAFPQFSSGTTPRPVRFSVQISAPGCLADLLAGGAPLRTDGRTEYQLPPEGQRYQLRLRMDVGRALPKKGATDISGNILLSSREAGDVRISFHYVLRIPGFGLRGSPNFLSLWWDPARKRTISLGTVWTDLAKATRFKIVIPDSLATDKGVKIADIGLLVDGHEFTGDASHSAAGLQEYGPLDLPAGGGTKLELLISPSQETHWQQLESTIRDIPIELRSDLGMESSIRPRFFSVGSWKWSEDRAIPRFGVYIALVAWLALGLLTVLRLAYHRLQIVRRFWAFQPGKVVVLEAGFFRIGGPPPGALILPASGSLEAGNVLARIYSDGNRQFLEDLSRGRLQVRGGPLASAHPLRIGDLVAVLDPELPENPPLWELEYLGFDQTEGGELEVVTSAAPMSLKRLLRKLSAGLGLVALGAVTLRAGTVASVAYHLPFLETVYNWFLG